MPRLQVQNHMFTLGSRHSAVRTIKQFLIAHPRIKCNLKSDDIFDAQTQTALADYQKHKRLRTNDGTMTEETYAAIGAEMHPTQLTIAATNNPTLRYLLQDEKSQDKQDVFGNLFAAFDNLFVTIPARTPERQKAFVTCLQPHVEQLYEDLRKAGLNVEDNDKVENYSSTGAGGAAVIALVAAAPETGGLSLVALGVGTLILTKWTTTSINSVGEQRAVSEARYAFGRAHKKCDAAHPTNIRIEKYDLFPVFNELKLELKK